MRLRWCPDGSSACGLGCASIRLCPLSPHSHPNRTQTVKVPSGQSWVTIPRGQLTAADKLLIWGTQEGKPLWSPVFVDLKTQSNEAWGGEGGEEGGCEGGRKGRGRGEWGVGRVAEGPSSARSGPPSAVKPDTPQIFSHVDISEEETLEATVQWAPPRWPPHTVLICQFQYKECRTDRWTPVSAGASFPPCLQWMGQHPKSHRARSHLPWSHPKSRIEGLTGNFVHLFPVF